MHLNGRQRAALLALVAGALYANALPNDFVWDDRLTATAPMSLGAILGSRTGPYYRPLVMLSFAADRAVWGAWPAGWHLTNVACHVAAAWLLGSLAAALGLGAGVSLAASLVFVAHPVQTEAVTYISGRTDVLCALFVVLSLLAWRRARRAIDGWAFATSVAFLAALLCKEAAAAVPLALLLPQAHPSERPPRPMLPIGVVAAWAIAAATSGGPGLHLGGLPGRLPAIAVAALGYLRLLLWPADMHLERFTPVGTWSIGAGIAAWTALAVAGVALLWLARRVPGGLFLLALAVLAYVPGAGIVPVYPAIADRALFTPEHFLYLPLLGLAPLAVAGVAAAWPFAAKGAAPVALAVVLAAWALVVVDRNRDWRDDETLFRDTVAYDPPSGRVWFNLGNLALAAGRLDEAARLYEAALSREPHDGTAHLNLGIVYQRQGRYEIAEAQYRAAVAANPRLREAYRGLAGLLAARGDTAEAARVLERAGGAGRGEARRP